PAHDASTASASGTETSDTGRMTTSGAWGGESADPLTLAPWASVGPTSLVRRSGRGGGGVATPDAVVSRAGPKGMAAGWRVRRAAGRNGLAAACRLQRAGLSVLLIEANNRPGGALWSEESTLPGHLHDVGAAFVAFSDSPAFAGLELDRFGLRYANAEIESA